MPQIPARQAGANIRGTQLQTGADFTIGGPNFASVSQGLGTLGEALLANARVKANAQEQTAGNTAASQFLLEVMPQVNEFIQQNKADANFGPMLSDFLQKATEAGENRDEVRALGAIGKKKYVDSLGTWAINTMGNGLALGNKAFQEDQDRIIDEAAENFVAVMDAPIINGVDNTPDIFSSTGLIDFNTAAAQGLVDVYVGAFKNGSRSGPEARAMFNDRIKLVIMDRLDSVMREFPTDVIRVMENNSLRVEVPRFNDKMEIIGTQEIELDDNVRQEVIQQAQATINRHISKAANDLNLKEQKEELMKRATDAEVTDRIAYNDPNVMDFVEEQTTEDGLALYTTSDRMAWLNLIDKRANAKRNSNAIYDPDIYQDLLLKAERGEIGNAEEIVTSEGITDDDEKYLLSISRASRKLRIDNETKDFNFYRKRGAKFVHKQFVVNEFLGIDPSLAKLANSAEQQYYHILRGELKKAGGDHTLVDPMEVSERVAKQFQEQFGVLLDAAAEHLMLFVKPYVQATIDDPTTTPEHHMRQARDAGNITDGEFRTSMMAWKGAKRRGYTIAEAKETLSNIGQAPDIKSQGIAKPSDTGDPFLRLFNHMRDRIIGKTTIQEEPPEED